MGEVRWTRFSAPIFFFVETGVDQSMSGVRWTRFYAPISFFVRIYGIYIKFDIEYTSYINVIYHSILEFISIILKVGNDDKYQHGGGEVESDVCRSPFRKGRDYKRERGGGQWGTILSIISATVKLETRKMKKNDLAESHLIFFSHTWKIRN